MIGLFALRLEDAYFTRPSGSPSASRLPTATTTITTEHHGWVTDQLRYSNRDTELYAESRGLSFVYIYILYEVLGKKYPTDGYSVSKQLPTTSSYASTYAKGWKRCCFGIIVKKANYSSHGTRQCYRK